MFIIKTKASDGKVSFFKSVTKQQLNSEFSNCTSSCSIYTYNNCIFIPVKEKEKLYIIKYIILHCIKIRRVPA